MTCNLFRMLDQLELPAPVAVGIILVGAALAKGGHSLLAIGGMVAFHALFIVARLALAGFKEQRAVNESAANRLDLSIIPTEPVKSLSLPSPVLPRYPRPSASPQAPLREAA
jgi:hypothetical protein